MDGSWRAICRLKGGKRNPEFGEYRAEASGCQGLTWEIS
jgi:hypothetical protein